MYESAMEFSVHLEYSSATLDISPRNDGSSGLGKEDKTRTKRKVSKTKQRRRDREAEAQSGSDELSASSQPHLYPSTRGAMPTLMNQQDPVTQIGGLTLGNKVDEPHFARSSDGKPSIKLETKHTNHKQSRSNEKKRSTADTRSSSASDNTIVPTQPLRFGFDDYRTMLKCRKNGCGKLTNCYDGDTVNCPRCGLRCLIRYCSLKCLLDPDMRFHWAQDCGQAPIAKDNFTFQLDKSTLIARPSASRPYIECKIRDNPARHRQAVFHSVNGTAGDYFVFNDFSLIPQGACDMPIVIGAGDVIATVSILPDYGLYVGQSIFYEVLEDCLRVGFSRPDKCLALVEMIMNQLVNSNQWNAEVQACLVFQMKSEFDYDVPPETLLRFRMMGPVVAT